MTNLTSNIGNRIVLKIRTSFKSLVSKNATMVVGKAVSSSYHMEYEIFIEASYNMHTGEKCFCSCSF